MDSGAPAQLHDIRPWRRIDRRPSRQVMVGKVAVGGGAPISVQSMTNTLTSDAQATIAQIRALEEAGADIVRVSCPDEDSTRAFSTIVRNVTAPLVADIHFHYKRAIEAAVAGAACLRINPGNIGSPARVRDVIQAAKDHGCSIRIGVNAGSLETHLLEKYGEPCPEAMVESALFHANLLEDHDFRAYKISVKASDPFLTVAAYQQLAEVTDAPLHLGVTEAGGLRIGITKSAIGIGSLLWAGIGDTIRVSLSADPVEEIQAGFDILKSLGLRARGVNIIACPSCARQGFNVIETVEILEQRLKHIIEPMSLSIIGCVVNGPGEALLTDLGFTGGGKGAGMVYMAGKADHKMDNAGMIDHIVDLVEQRAATLRAGKSAMSVSPDIQATFDYLFALAEKALSEGRSFAPFATSTLHNGGRLHSTADLNAAGSTPQEHMTALLDTLKREASDGGIRAAGLAFDTVAPFTDGKTGDAVCVHAETSDGDAVQIFVPYDRALSVVPRFEQPVVQSVAARIFIR